MKILCVSPFKPFPQMHGGTVDIWTQVSVFLALGHEVSLIYCTKEQNELHKENFPKEFNLFSAIYPVLRQNKLSSFFSKTPLQINSRNSLSSLNLTDEYELTVLYSEYVIAILQNNSLKTKKVVLRVQNDEANYFNELSKSTNKIPLKLYFFSESLKFKLLSKKTSTLIQTAWHISNEEIKKSNYSNNVHIPPALNTPFRTQSLSSKNVLFVASLHMKNNLEALTWYLKGAHLLLCHKFEDYRLIVCGSASDVQIKKILNKYKNYPNIEFYFNEPSLEKYYKKSSMFINTMKHGAGVKLKSINAITNGLPLVSTSTGVEGIGLKPQTMFRLANTQSEFLKEISSAFQEDLEDRQLMVLKAQNYLKNNDSKKIIKEQLKK